MTRVGIYMPIFKAISKSVQEEVEEVPAVKEGQVIYIRGKPHKVVGMLPTGALLVQDLETGEVRQHVPT